MKRLVKPYGRLLLSVVVLLAFAAAAVLLMSPLASQTEEEEEAAPPKIEAKKNVLDGREVGEVLINDEVVIRLQRAAGGYSSYERAQKVAERLTGLVAGGLQPSDLRAGYSANYPAVLAGDELVITADRFHADLNGTQPIGLAKTWANQIRGALVEKPGEGEAGATGEPGETEPPGPVFRPEEYDDKWVPIISAGDGIHIGGARVNGPKTELGQVQGVAMVELNWDKFVDIKVRVYVPISTKVPGKTLARVQRCNVTAVGDFEL